MELYGKKYKLSDSLVLKDGKIPLSYWTMEPNFGDLLSPYLINKLTELPVKHVFLRPGIKKRKIYRPASRDKFSYFAIGSIIRRINSKSIVWGSGAFGTEGNLDFNPNATITAVRGPLTRNLLRLSGVECPEVYGDPALLLPEVFNPNPQKKYKVGVVLRWAESEWDKANFGTDVKKINMASTDIEPTLKEMLECENIISSSLHGIILADAYGIPSAWLSSTTPKGLHFKFYDYFISVDKIQKPQVFDFSRSSITSKDLSDNIQFNGKKINFDGEKLLESCPMLTRE